LKQTLIANDASSRLGALPNSLPSLWLIWLTQLVKGLGPKLGIWILGGAFSSHFWVLFQIWTLVLFVFLLFPSCLVFFNKFLEHTTKKEHL